MNYRRFLLGPLQTNSYLVWDGAGRGFMVDPAGDAGEVFEFAGENKISIEAILLTHGHPDHIGGLEYVLERVDAPVYIGEDDAQMLRSPDQKTVRWLGYDFKGFDGFSVLRDGDVLSVGDLTIKVLGTPGHTPGCVCLLVSVREDEGRILLSGDTLFAGSVGRTDLPGGDSDVLRGSIARLAMLSGHLPVLPGHGPETTLDAERRYNPFWPEEG
ncbi:MAG: MBL fold metallo-hydrolase [Aminobacteriaceae bacterium]